MTFDMGRAWNDAMKMVGANKDVLSIVAGVFYFLPSLALNVLAPMTELAAAGDDPEKAQAAMLALLSSYWWMFVLYVVVTAIGGLAIYALIGRHNRPTVGEAITIGVKAFLPYLAATLIMAIGFSAMAILVGLISGATGSGIVAIILGILMVAVVAFVSIRLALVGAVMAIEGVYNPIDALARSWNLIKGNTRFVFAFLLMIIIAVVVVYLVLNMFFGLIGAMLGAEAALWIQAVLGGLLGAAVSVLMLSIYSAIHQQLGGGTSQADLATFE